MKKDLFLGIDTGGTRIKYLVADRAGATQTSGEVVTDSSSITVSMERLGKAVASILGGDGDFPRLAGLGMACAGIVNPVTGHLGRSPNLLGWQDRDLAGEIKAVFRGVPVALVNDVNGALYGEFRQGAGRDCRNLVMIALGTGVGGGVILDGKLLLGSHFGAGEIGHMVLDPAGPPCSCGGQGCLEAWAGSNGILRLAREAASQAETDGALAELVAQRGRSLTTFDLAGLAQSGDATTAEIFALAGRRLGQAIGNLVNLLDPDRVLVGGGVAQAGDLILKPCRESVPPLVLAAAAKDVPVVAAELGPQAAAVGAACLARELEQAG